MSQIKANIMAVQENIAQAACGAGRNPQEITLVAATKTQTTQTIHEAIRAGIAVCGENRVQELTGHLDEGGYPNAQIHFIGHLQTNKVKYVVGQVDVIESVGSIRLLDAIHKQGEKLGIVQDILLEVNIGEESQKSGFLPSELDEGVAYARSLAHVRLRGLMAIPPATDNPINTIPYFKRMYQLFIDIQGKIDHNKSDIDCLSMGMSGDYPQAIEAGATHVRVGTALFGYRT